jgi:hypothetical protein
MQRIGRGFVTRKWFEIQYRHAFLERVEIPAAIKLEALARMRAQVVLMAGRKQGCENERARGMYLLVVSSLSAAFISFRPLPSISFPLHF